MIVMLGVFVVLVMVMIVMLGVFIVLVMVMIVVLGVFVMIVVIIMVALARAFERDLGGFEFTFSRLARYQHAFGDAHPIESVLHRLALFSLQLRRRS